MEGVRSRATTCNERLPGWHMGGILGTGQDVLGLVTESGEFHFLDANELAEYMVRSQ